MNAASQKQTKKKNAPIQIMYFIVIMETLLCQFCKLSTSREGPALFTTWEIITTIATPENGMSDRLSQFDGKLSFSSFCFSICNQSDLLLNHRYDFFLCFFFFFLFLAPCEGNTFFCHSNMCINNTLVCNGLQNCVYPWDENHCKGKDRFLKFAKFLCLQSGKKFITVLGCIRLKNGLSMNCLKLRVYLVFHL